MYFVSCFFVFWLLLVCSSVCCCSLTWLLPTYCSRSLFPACYSFAWFPTCYSPRVVTLQLLLQVVLLSSGSPFLLLLHIVVPPAWLLLTCYSPAWLLTYYSPCGYSMSLLPTYCSHGGCSSLVAFAFFKVHLTSLIVATPRLLLSYSSLACCSPTPASRVTPYLLVAACVSLDVTFHLIFFLQAMFGATTIKQKPASKASFFFQKNFTFYLNIFRSFLKKIVNFL